MIGPEPAAQAAAGISQSSTAGVGPKKPRKPDRRRAITRRAILDAAALLFAARGVGATTVEDIAGAARLSVGTLYFHFSSKEGVVLGLVGEILESTEHFLSMAPATSSALDRVLLAGDAYFRLAIEQPIAFRFVSDGVPQLPAGASPAAIAETSEISARIERFVGTVSDDLRDAIADGEIDAVPLDAALAFIWGAWNGVAGLVLRDDKFAVPSEVAERALALGRSVLLRGLGGTPR